MIRSRGVAVGLFILLAAGVAEGQNGKAGEFRSADQEGPVLRAVVSHTAEAGTVAVQGVATPAMYRGIGVQGTGGEIGVEGRGALGVYGVAEGSVTGGGNVFGVYGEAFDAQHTFGVRAVAQGSAVGHTTYGVHAYASGPGTNYAVYADGDVVYTGSLVGPASDLRLKEGLTRSEGALAKLLDLEVVRFTYRDTPEAAALHLPEGTRVGFVAQQVAEVLPELVVDVVHPPAGDRMPGHAAASAAAQLDEPLVYLGIKTMEMIPLLVQALQEQQAEIAALREELAPLRHRLAGLELEAGACEPPVVVAAAR